MKHKLNVNILEALFMLNMALNHVSQNTIGNCFGHCSFKQDFLLLDDDIVNVEIVNTPSNDNSSDEEVEMEIENEIPKIGNAIKFLQKIKQICLIQALCRGGK